MSLRGTIYTHAIPWAMHTKIWSKQNRKPNASIGNKLDKLIQNCQDGQTRGIPIGPDTSLLLAEILLTPIDLEISQLGVPGIRYVDDYFFACNSEREAETVGNTLRKWFKFYALDVNEGKTTLTHEHGSFLREEWLSDFKSRAFSGHPNKQKFELISCFDRAMKHRSENPRDGVLKLICGRMRHLPIHRENWELVEDLLIRAAFAEPGALPFVLATLIRNNTRYAAIAQKIHNCLTQLIVTNCQRGHSSEVAWSLWGHLVLNIQLNATCSPLILEMADPICSLLALQLRSMNLTADPHTLSRLSQYLTTENLHGPQWILAYEASIKNWLTPATPGDFIAGSPNFAVLRQSNVTFQENAITRFLASSIPYNTSKSKLEKELDAEAELESDYSQEEFWEFDDLTEDEEEEEEEEAEQE